ncbi:Histidyl-tRNA synthetase [Mycobacteroides abscessus subsp. abscessus]|uniref:Histidine--tRNA ligase n=1 Tax=Dermabacter vaginalis TaxID=1630135 RepID=A0ABX6A6Q9_9MICO|nr:histidine--tRNA ligase [Dermabacter vaginalis]MCG7444199.1 histidine--tRNA ligase [Dermabacter vaginalis]QEU12061.1 histidine--tRNA ligase [Dermabacter vaginalis]SHV78113.1 Histidyl-tRNA synthetase [Mycobacteroides abscessus subsp. abscessus]
MAKVTPLSGFPEWLPAERRIEQHVMDTFREVAELHGFSNIETRAVEPLDQLLRKGETSKEVYLISRLQAEEEEREKESQKLGLHFDLTVPLARYVLEHQNDLAFPFRRYQIQKVWRGERPQDGRFREFYQADIDIIGQDTLPSHMDADVAIVMAEVLGKLPIPGFTISINNRKLSQGVFEALGLSDIEGVLRQLDKLAKVGEAEVRKLLIEQVGASEEQADGCLAFASIKATHEDLANKVGALGVSSDDITNALEELSFVIRTVNSSVPGACIADLSIARGLDYYTGTVFETFVEGHEDLGSICSGGRYDTLATDNRHSYPGVGLSIGLSRLVSRLVTRALVTSTRAVPTVALVAVMDEEHRDASVEVARVLRSRGIAAEVAPSAAKFGKQIKYADRRGIPFVFFPSAEGEGEVKDIRSGEQVAADAHTWQPTEDDMTVRVVAATPGN